MFTKSENTFRALQDLEPFVERWQCRLGLHRWTKWSQAEKNQTTYTIGSIASDDIYYWQHRHCIDCNLAKRRKVGGVL